MLQLTAAAFRYAICLNRILVLQPFKQQSTFTKWRFPGCNGNTFECFFKPITNCHISVDEFNLADAANLSSPDGFNFEKFPLRNERILSLRGMVSISFISVDFLINKILLLKPTYGRCTLCFSEWQEDSSFFDGMKLNDNYFHAFMTSTKQVWSAQFLRFLLRPRKWLVEVIQEIVSTSLYSPNFSKISILLNRNEFPLNFISMHVRYGMKSYEAQLQPLSKYMGFMTKKFPHIHDIFVSTETENVLDTLIRSEYI
jgi:hypothetical protein